MFANNRFVTYLADYASYHITVGNQRTHVVGIPMITIAVYGLFAQFHLALGTTFLSGSLALDGGLIAWIVATLWYFSLDAKIGLPTSLASLACYLLGRWLPLPVLLALFVVGWIIQFVGHVHYEKNQPAFYKNFEHLLIGPAWAFGKLFRYLPEMQAKRQRLAA